MIVLQQKMFFVGMRQIFSSKIVPMLTKMSRLIKPKILVMQSEQKILFLTKFMPLINQVEHRRSSVMWINEGLMCDFLSDTYGDKHHLSTFTLIYGKRTERFPQGNYSMQHPSLKVFLKPLYQIKQLQSSKWCYFL